MSAGESYPVDLTTLEGTVRESGLLVFTDSTDQPAQGSGAIATPTAVAPTGLTGSISATRYVGGTASIAPTAGAHNVGDWVVTLTGRIFVCTVAGTPGTWVEPASVTFAPLASPTFTGAVTVPAAAATTSAPRLSQLTSALTIVSGTLPNTGSWVSGTAKVNPVTRQVTAYIECAFDGTANAATVVIAVSPDDSTYTTVGTPGVSAGVNTAGASTELVPVSWPAGWFIKLTIAAHATVAASIYY